MTRPRQSSARELFGILGSPPYAADVLREWNAYFAKQRIDAVMTKYPAKREQIPERLSEMFHFDRRAYLVDPRLAQDVCPLLDSLDDASQKEGKVSLILNTNGVLQGQWHASHAIEDLCQLFCL